MTSKRLHKMDLRTHNHCPPISLQVTLILFSTLCPTNVFSHGGGLNADGCHNNRIIGGYHCHRSPRQGTAAAKQQLSDPLRANLYDCTPSNQTISSRTTIKTVQTLLKALGYYAGAIDGLAGSGTKAALQKYQKEHRLLVTGTINDSILLRLSTTVALQVDR